MVHPSYICCISAVSPWIIVRTTYQVICINFSLLLSASNNRYHRRTPKEKFRTWDRTMRMPCTPQACNTDDKTFHLNNTIKKKHIAPKMFCKPTDPDLVHLNHSECIYKQFPQRDSFFCCMDVFFFLIFYDCLFAPLPRKQGWSWSNQSVSFLPAQKCNC